MFPANQPSGPAARRHSKARAILGAWDLTGRLEPRAVRRPEGWGREVATDKSQGHLGPGFEGVLSGMLSFALQHCKFGEG